MHRIRVFDFENHHAWLAHVSHAWLLRNPNDHAVSIGYVLGEDIRPAQLQAFLRTGRAYRCDYDTANRSKGW
jgi:hypothetical protein